MKIKANIEFPIQYEMNMHTGKKIAKITITTDGLPATVDMVDEEVDEIVYVMKPVIFKKQFRTQVDFKRIDND